MRIRDLFGALLAAMLLATPAIWTANVRADSHEGGEKVSGEALYMQYCASCHGAEGRGNGPIAGDLKVAPTDLTLLAAKAGGKVNDTRLREVIDGRVEVRTHGPRDMPVWGKKFSQDRDPGQPREQISRAKTRALAAYVVSLQNKSASMKK